MSTYKMPTIREGDTGCAVAMLQGILAWRDGDGNGNPFYTGEVDGEYGPKTAAAVEKYQFLMHELGADFDVDGICGNQTWDSLLAMLPKA